MDSEIVRLRDIAKNVARMFENDVPLSPAERGQIGSSVGMLRAWLQQWDKRRREKAGG